MLEMAKKFDCGDTFTTYPDGCNCSAWSVPMSAFLPLLYWIIFNSIVAYLILTWGNQYANPSLVLGYTALQPLTSSLLSVLINAVTSKYDIAEPGYNLLGGIVIIIGLYMLIYDNKKQEAAAAAAASPGLRNDFTSGEERLLAMDQEHDKNKDQPNV